MNIGTNLTDQFGRWQKRSTATPHMASARGRTKMNNTPTVSEGVLA